MTPPRSSCCLQLVEKCPPLHPRVFGCQEGDLSLPNARIWININPSHCEGERAVSVCPSREIFASRGGQRGDLPAPFLTPVQPFLFLSACRWWVSPPGHLAFAPHLEDVSHPECSCCKNSSTAARSTSV